MNKQQNFISLVSAKSKLGNRKIIVGKHFCDILYQSIQRQPFLKKSLSGSENLFHDISSLTAISGI